MRDFSVGVMLESFRTDVKTAVEHARGLSADGLQIYASRGEYSHENATPAKFRELLSLVKSNGMVFSAVCGDFQTGFGNKKENITLIEQSKRVIEIAKYLETDIITTHIGVIPQDSAHDRYEIMLEACCELAEYAKSMDACYAIETGPETAEVLKAFLDKVNSKGLMVNFDPANLVMVTGDNPVRAVYTLRDYIVHTHAKDGRKLRDCDPEVVYRVVEATIEEGRDFIELPLGEGDVNFSKYLEALTDIGYNGFLTIEREVGENPVSDIKKATDYLRGLTKSR